MERAGANPQAIDQLCSSYIDNVKAYVSGAPSNETLMRSVEVCMDLPQSRKDDYRRSLLNYIGALAIEGKIFDVRTNPRLLAALEEALSPDDADQGSSESLADRGLRLLREGAAPIGVMSITAQGVSRPLDDASKLVEARRCLEQALDAGDLRAAKPLAAMLREGLGGSPDVTRARALYTQICERSQDRGAIVALALMTAHGEGGPRDPRRAYQLLRPVAASGDLTAVAALLDLAESPDEVAEAERFASAAKQALLRPR